jgi:hypothetical protein
MKSNPQEKNKRAATIHAAPLAGDEPQAKARDDAEGQSQDLSLEVIHSDPAGIDIGNEWIATF